jgi:hypothetical protein
MKCFILIISLSLCWHAANSQKKGNNYTNSGHGQQNNNTGRGQQNNNTGPGSLTVNNNNKNITYQLPKHESDDYLKLFVKVDTTRDITIVLGKNNFAYDNESLRQGFAPLATEIVLGKRDTSTLKVRLVKDRLLISSKCYPFEGKIPVVKIVENVVVGKMGDFSTISGYQKIGTKNGVLVKDADDIPIFNLTFNKKDNSISLSGVFFFDDDYKILSKNGITRNHYPKPYLKMSQGERDSVFYEIKRMYNEALNPNLSN